MLGLNLFRRTQPLRFSIVVPVLNSGRTLGRALESILNQSTKPQLIVVDGGSTDDTPSILRKFEKHIDILIVESDSGQSQALNKGFARATGDWHGWLCGDDELAPRALHQVSEVVQTSPGASLVTGACVRVLPDGTTIQVAPPSDPLSLLAFKNPLDQPSTFWKRDLHLRAGQFDERLHYAMDWEWWCRLAKAGARFARCHHVLSVYHFSAGNKTSSNPQGNLEESLEILRRHGAFDGSIAQLYRYIFEHFDLPGCLETSPTVSPELKAEWERARLVVSEIFGPDALRNYNLGWISKQLRGQPFL